MHCPKYPLVIGFSLMALLLIGCSSPETRYASQVVDTNTEKPLMNGLVKGDIPPDFSVAMLDGKMLSLESFNRTPVLLYFFTTWCPYCAEDLSTLSTLYADYESDLNIVAIGMDLGESAEKIGQYRKRYPALAGVLFATGNMDVLISYQIKYTTTKYAMGRDGRILYAGSGVLTEQQWRTLLDAMKKY